MFTGPQDRSLLPLQPSHQHLQHLGPCDHAVQTVVTSATVHKPREFKSLCARSAGPSCPYCAGWVAVEAQHCTVILQQIHNIACYLACTAHTSAGGKLGVTTHCSTLAWAWWLGGGCLTVFTITVSLWRQLWLGWAGVLAGCGSRGGPSQTEPCCRCPHRSSAPRQLPAASYSCCCFTAGLAPA